MIQLSLDWREVLWWMQGGMAGSHLRWSVYEDMVNRVWPQATEQERRNMFLIMRRDLGTYWRPDGWNGHRHMQEKGEGPWKILVDGEYGRPSDIIVDNEADRREMGRRQGFIMDETPWTYFRQVLARFDPDNQWAVTMQVTDSDELKGMLNYTPKGSVISCPTLITAKGYVPEFDMSSAPLTVRAYRWQDEYRIDWSHRIAKDAIVKAEQIDIPDEGTM